jgi:hypothetical protein
VTDELETVAFILRMTSSKAIFSVPLRPGSAYAINVYSITVNTSLSTAATSFITTGD